jgi:hypothetical protein
MSLEAGKSNMQSSFCMIYVVALPSALLRNRLATDLGHGLSCCTRTEHPGQFFHPRRSETNRCDVSEPCFRSSTSEVDGNNPLDVLDRHKLGESNL